MSVSRIPSFVNRVGHFQSLGKQWRWRILRFTKTHIFVDICPGFTKQAISFNLHILIIALTVPSHPPTMRRLSSYLAQGTKWSVSLEILASFTDHWEFLGDVGHR